MERGVAEMLLLSFLIVEGGCAVSPGIRKPYQRPMVQERVARSNVRPRKQARSAESVVQCS